MKRLLILFALFPAFAGAQQYYPYTTYVPEKAGAVYAANYGFVCDGSTDNANAMSNLNTAIAALGSAGGSVYFAPQTAACLTSVALVPKSNVNIYARPGTVILQPTASSSANPVLLNIGGGGQNNILIYGLTFDGGGPTIGNANPVISVGGVNNAIFDTVTVQNTHGRGIFFGGTVSYSGVRNSTFVNIGNDWKTTLSSADRFPAVLFQTAATNKNNFIVDSYFQDIGLDAMAVVNQTNFVIANNRCSIYNNQYGIIAGLGGNYPNCIFFSTNVGGSITGNTLAGANGNGIGLDSSTNVVVSGNFVRDSGSAGITVPSGAAGVTVTGNTVIDNNQYAATSFPGGIVLTGTTNKVTISGNTAYDDQGSPTQQYGLNYGTFAGAVTANELQVFGNNFAGNVLGPIGGSPTLNMSAATWGLNGIINSIPAQNYNDTTTGSGGVTNDAAVSIGAPTFTNTQGTANTLTNAIGLYIGAPVCGGSWAACTSKYSLFAAGQIGGNLGASIIGPVFLNQNSASAVNLNTGSSAGTTTIGNASSTLALNAGTWTIASGTTVQYTHGVTVICQVGATVTSGSVTTEVNLAVCGIPANYMGTNGMVRVTITWSNANTATAKTANIRLASTAGTPGVAWSTGTAVLSQAMTTSVTAAQSLTIIRESNAANSQTTHNQFVGTSLGGAVTTTSLTTSSIIYINIDCIDASSNGSSETCGISGYTVELLTP